MPGFPVYHQLLKLAQTHICSVSDAIQSAHPLLSPSPPVFNLSQHQSFLVSQFFTSGGQSIGVSASASVLPMNIQDRFPLGLTGLSSLQSKGLSRVFFIVSFMNFVQFDPQNDSTIFSSHLIGGN